MFNTKLYSVLIVSLNQDFVSKIKQKLQRKGYNTYSFESKEKYEDFIKYESAKVDYYILDIRDFGFHYLLTDYFIPGVIIDISVTVGFISVMQDKLKNEKYPVHSEELGVKYCSNNKNTYYHFFEIFNKEYRNLKTDFMNAIALYDINKARKLIHGLRGISLNLGSKPLYQYTSYIDEVLKEQIDKKYKKIRTRKIKHELEKVFEILNVISQIN